MKPMIVQELGGREHIYIIRPGDKERLTAYTDCNVRAPKSIYFYRGDTSPSIQGVTIDSSWVKMGGPAPAVSAPDATCTLLPLTSFPKNKIKVLLLENISHTAVEMFESERFQIETAPGALTEAELVEKLRDVHVLGIRSKMHVSAEAIKAARRLLAIGCFCIGTNQVDLEAANLRGVPVFNAPFSNTRSVAELVIGEVIALARQLGDRSAELHRGTWKKVAQGCFEIRGKTLGIVGYGHIGSQVGVLAEMLGMHVKFFDIATKMPMGNNSAVATLEELLSVSDFVTLHVPLSDATTRMIGAAQLQHMRKGSYLINASRGSVVDLAALADALREGRIAGAAVDVYPTEPEKNSSAFTTELQGLANVILTPHIGGSTEEAQAAIGREVATSLIKYVNRGTTTGAVNFPQLEFPQDSKSHRILNVHQNVPGVLRNVNSIISDLDVNIKAQVNVTDSNIGYLVMDLDKAVSHEVEAALRELPTSIKTRILY
ncbi:D-3-phosphoglycerate dehydrogenase [Coccomyxa sp. Obi]|nr:D-3-phosphoglycerate dehydrogenase [Coccomyxa sp. Obi]